MKKRWLLGLSVLTLSLCACGKSKDTTTEKLATFETTELTTEAESADAVKTATENETVTEKETTTENETTTEKETTDGATSSELLMYEDKLVECCNVIADYSSDEIVSDGMIGIFETVGLMGKQEAARALGYAFKDLNGDEVPELIIGFIDDQSNNTGKSIFAVYAYENNQAKLVLEGWGRNYYALTENNHFMNQASSGAQYFGYGSYKLDEQNKLVCEDYYFSSPVDDNQEEIGYFHSTTDDWNVANAEKMDIDGDAFSAKGEELKNTSVSIEFEPLATFAEEHNITISE